MAKRLNQNKPNPLLAQIEPHIRRLWKARLTDKEILAELRKHIDSDEYGIGLTKFKAIRKQLRLCRTHQQGLTPDDIREVMVEMRIIYPDAGVREMIGLLFHEHGLAVSRSVMSSYFLTYEAHLLSKRKANHLQCRRFWAAGVNDIWAVDQHDKWLRFGLALHTGIKPFSGHILWVKKNIMPEIAWSQLRQRFSPGFESLLDSGVDAGWYDPDNTLQLMVFRWLFIPWLQVELNNYHDHINNSRKRHNRKKVLPHGIPELIYTCAEDYGALDFKVMVSPAAIDHIRQVYIDPKHVIFDLIPPTLSTFLYRCYHQLGCPSCKGIPAILTGIETEEHETVDELQLLPGLQDLHETEGYMEAAHIRALDQIANDEPEPINAAPSLLVA
ncbi:hypothetical protein SCLCIDRAFT_29984 [Scleroderma citrinum Foug A]|uniref:Uncharacterized protein n=1 Tax=Scleroderma citrinum Foug A TaxID=1036808 RepID=A0A0C3DHV6_9AGAM|nr:hypothetical protein SCLCIDRAFT_29984 [Scleroderma citrinum Foug A]